MSAGEEWHWQWPGTDRVLVSVRQRLVVEPCLLSILSPSSKLRHSWQLLVILGENFPRWPPPSTKSSPGGNFRSASLPALAALFRRIFRSELNSAFFSSSFDFLRHQTSNNRTSPSSGHSTVGSTIRRRIPTRFHHTHTLTHTLTRQLLLAQHNFSLFCALSLPSFREPLFFRFLRDLLSPTGYDGHFYTALFHGRVLPSCWSTTSEHSRVWPTFGVPQTLLLLLPTGQPSSSCLSATHTQTRTHTHVVVVDGKPLLGQLGNLPRKTEKRNGPCLARCQSGTGV